MNHTERVNEIIERDGFWWIRDRVGYRLSEQDGYSVIECTGGVEDGYQPFEKPDLLADFIEIHTSEDALRFAGKYGLLGLPNPKRAHIFLGDLWPIDPEPVTSWLRESEQLREAHKVWEAVQGSNLDLLRRYVRWTNSRLLGRQVRFHRLGGPPFNEHPHVKEEYLNIRHMPKTEWRPADLNLPEKMTAGEFADSLLSYVIGSPSKNTKHYQTWKTGDVVEPAKLHLAQEITAKLKPGYSTSITVTNTGEFQSNIRPRNLLVAIWLTFADVVRGIRRVIRCEAPDCRRLIDVTENRSHKRIHDRCSNRLRMRRLREKEAEETKNAKAKDESKTRKQ